MASIRFITAPIGGGKSLFGTMKICEELERTDRYIVTNIPLVLAIADSPARQQRLFERLAALSEAKNSRKAAKFDTAPLYWTLAEYCNAFIKRPVDVKRRVVCLTEEQTREFWRYLPCGDFDSPLAGAASVKVQFGVDCEPPSMFVNESEIRPSMGFVLPNTPDQMHGHVPDFTFRKGKPGCYYVLDEVHQHFSSRLWQKTGTQAERYMSQLRKLNDDLDLITQHPEKVDKNFRRNATDWLQVQNMSKSPLFMGVTFDKRFRCLEYQQAEMPLRFDKPSRTSWYRLDGSRRYEWLYKTAEGVGVSGGIVAEESRFKGRHWSIWVVAVLAIIVASYFFPKIMMNTITKLVSASAGAFQHGVQNGLTGKLPTPATPPPIPPRTEIQSAQAGIPQPVLPPWYRTAPPPAAISPEPDLGGLFCNGVMRYPDGRIDVILSDGRVAHSDDGEVQDVGKRYVKVFGLPKIPLKDAK